MRTITLSFAALLATALFLTACGDGGKAARAVKIKDLEAQAKALNADFAAKAEGWQVIKNKVIPARIAWKRAKGTGEEDALKQAFKDAQAASNTVIEEERLAQRAIQKIEDEVARLKAIR